MRIRSFDFIGIIFYPHILNPFIWILIAIFIPHLIFLSWWSTKRDGKYTTYFIDKYNFNKYKKDFVFVIVGAFINSLWVNKNLTLSYTRYLEELWFPYYPKDDWRRKDAIDKNYKYYLNVKNGKFKQ